MSRLSCEKVSMLTSMGCPTRDNNSNHEKKNPKEEEQGDEHIHQ